MITAIILIPSITSTLEVEVIEEVKERIVRYLGTRNLQVNERGLCALVYNSELDVRDKSTISDLVGDEFQILFLVASENDTKDSINYATAKLISNGKENSQP